MVIHVRRQLRNHGLHPVQDRAGSHRSTHDRGISWRPSLIDRLASVAVRETVMHYRKSEVLCTENGKGHNGTAGRSKAGCRRRRVVGGRVRSVGYMWGPSLLGSSYDQAAPLHPPVWGKRSLQDSRVEFYLSRGPVVRVPRARDCFSGGRC